MDIQNLHAQATVEGVLQKWPGAFAFFTAIKVKCPGCLMQQFCTIKDVAEAYDIPLPELICDLKDCVQNTIHYKGVSP